VRQKDDPSKQPAASVGSGPISTENAAAAPTGNHRWLICVLLFFATTSNYMDRQVMSILAPHLQKDVFHWTDAQYGFIVTGFQATYALGLLLFGSAIDKIGTKRGYTISATLWSLAACSHAFARSILGFGVARMALGISESGNFPAAIKAVAEWFPSKERALATGIFNSGANVGAVLAPAIVPWLTLTYGWQASFLVIGLIGFVFVAAWTLVYKKPADEKRLTAGELTYILSTPHEAAEEAHVPWSSLLNHRQTWGYVSAKLCTDPIWWFYLYWLPKFLNTRHGLDLSSLGLPIVTVYMMSTVGSIGGGQLSSLLIRRGLSVDRSRKSALLLCAICVVPIMAASVVSNLWLAVFLIGLAAAAHQGWSANLFTTASDIYPKPAVASLTGLGGMAGSIGGMVFSSFAGVLLQWTHSYLTLFMISGSAYIVAYALFCFFVPVLEPVNLNPTASTPA
jgi:MFS transporter, ACS family, hexuronate transporter